MKSSGHETSLIIPQKNSTSFIFNILEGFHDQSILAKDKGGKTIITNRESPCRIEVLIRVILLRGHDAR